MIKDQDYVERLEVEFERRPQAVLVADIVGYTRLMEVDEIGTHTHVRQLRVNSIDPTIINHRGELVKNTGDGYIAIFEAPLDAVNCAIELQRRICSSESRKLPERRIEFRMGIHWESVIFDLDDVYGHGVNTAVRLQQVAPAGGIVISAPLRVMIEDVKNLRIDDLGELRLKNFSRSVHAFLIIDSKLDGTFDTKNFTVTRDRFKLPSIAILPFQNINKKSDDDYFAEGFVSDIISSLSNIEGLFVISRGSTITFRKISIDPLVVGHKLGVQYFVSGRVSRSGSHVRLWVDLVDVVSRSILWSEKYALKFNEIFDLQDDITFKIVSQVATHIQEKEIKRALRKPPESLNAYDYFLQALDLLYKLDFESFTQARVLLERARDDDPTYAVPFAFSAHWHMFNLAEGWSSDGDADAKEVIRLTNCAVERDPANALAFAIQGQAKAIFFREYDSAIECVDHSTSISPNNSWAWTFSSGPYGLVGETKTAISQAEYAVRLSPIDRQAFFKLCLLSQNHYLNGTFEDAARWSRKALSLNPRFGNAARLLSASLIALGRDDEARRIAKHHLQILPRFRVSDYARRSPLMEPAASAYIERLLEAGLPR